MNKGKLYMFMSIGILALTIVGSTFAYYREVVFNDLGANTITHGLDYYINYAKGQDITGGTLVSTSDYTLGNNVTVEFYKKDNTYDIYGHIYLDVVQIGEHSKSSEALKYTLTDGNGIVASGSLYGSKAGDAITIKTNVPLTTTRQTYTLYIWIDENETLDSEMENEVLELKLRCEATMKTI